MNRFFRKPKTIGQAPGSLLHPEQVSQEEIRISLIRYNPERTSEERLVERLSDCLPLDSQDTVSWININGNQQIDILEELGSLFSIHPLVLEDIHNTIQRPKLEDYDQYLFIEMNMLSWNSDSAQIDAEQISLLLGETYLITFQESKKDVFDAVRKRIREGKSRLTNGGPDYPGLFADRRCGGSLFPCAGKYRRTDRIPGGRAGQDPDPETLHAIHDLKRELIFIRKSVWPLREVISALERGELPLLPGTNPDLFAGCL